MRHAKGKHAKRAKGFFTLAAGFKQPYKILLDGNFIHTALVLRMEDMDKRLAALLMANAKKGVKLYVTPCVLAELERIGPEYAETLAWAKEMLTVLSCPHKDGPAQPDECIKHIIGNDNEEHYFVGTQDKMLRGSLGEVKGGATLFLSANGLHISQPTETQRWLAGQGVVENMLPDELELQSQALGELDSLRQPLTTSGRFKKKKKGQPNPLSVKKGKGEKKAKRVGPALRRARKEAAAAGAEPADGASGGNLTRSQKKSANKKAKKRRKKAAREV